MRKSVVSAVTSCYYDECFMVEVKAQPKFNPITKEYVQVYKKEIWTFEPEVGVEYDMEFFKVEIPDVGERTFWRKKGSAK